MTILTRHGKRGRPRKTQSKPSAVKVGKGYRLLRPNETLRAGDEYWCWWTRRWVATSFEGEKPKGGAYRRPTKQGAGI